MNANSPVSHSNVSSSLCKDKKCSSVTCGGYFSHPCLVQSHFLILKRFLMARKDSQKSATAYQRYGIDPVQPADGVLQLLRRQAAQQTFDGADAVHDHRDVHPGLQTEETPHGQLAHHHMYLLNHVPVYTDLGPQQVRHLPVVAAEHLLQTQPARGGEVQVACVFYKQTAADTPPTEQLLSLKSLDRDDVGRLTSYLQVL